MRVVVCGSRAWTDRGRILARLRELPADTLVITGGASGADRLAEDCAGELLLDRRTYSVSRDEWEKHGKAAGPMRNQRMIDSGPDLVIAFRVPGRSRGTDDCVRRARAAGVPVEVVDR